jgi:hypothetical protein
MKLRDIKQGRTIYLVSAFPFDDEFNKNNANIRKLLIMSRPYQKELAGKMMWRFRSKNCYGNINEEFCATWRIAGDNTYNDHRAFFSLREANRFLNRMLSGCLTPHEQERTNAIKKNRLRRKALDDLFPMPEFFMPEPEPVPYGTQLFSMSHYSVVVPDSNAVIRINGVV